MKNTHLIRMAIMALTISVLSGCLLVPVDDGFGPGDSRGSDRGGHHDNRHDRQDDRGEHR